MKTDRLIGNLSLSERELLDYSISTLAWVGDAVFELYVRTALAGAHPMASGALHRLATRFVSARGQAALVDKLEKGEGGFLLETSERGLLNRARNYHATSMSRHAVQADYRKATAFEALVGWLWLQGKKDRLDDLIASLLDASGTKEPHHASGS